LGCSEFAVSRIDGCGISKGSGDGGLGFLEAISKLFDIADNLLEGSSSSLTLSIDTVKTALYGGVRLLGVGAEGTGTKEHGDAGCVEGVYVLGFIMMDGGVAKGFEVIAGSKEALGERGVLRTMK